tara:strand:- start:215 stop:649 length:435 start_codon:yes stop_codon:yes gene_type:complete
MFRKRQETSGNLRQPQHDLRVSTSEVMLRTKRAKTSRVGQAHSDPWRGVCGGVLNVITCCYCFGLLKPEEEEETLRDRLVVAQPILSTNPSKEVVVAEPVVEETLRKPRGNLEETSPAASVNKNGSIEVGTGSHLPLLNFHTWA